PALLVLGDETRASGFKLSLLERLQMEYEKIGGPAKDYLVTLSSNYRCHRDILAIPHQLFYSGLKSKAKKADPHPNAQYPLLFVCSNLTSDVCSPDIEARVLLEQVNFFVQHWPSDNSSWGKYELNKIAVVTSTRPQVQ
ncbi:MAG: C-terminal helicase domain-containing protein, partial [Proteobacteria bacterium]|nr:C-terminal helicase domain-containing protein [Pseudomonadota bacterium]